MVLFVHSMPFLERDLRVLDGVVELFGVLEVECFDATLLFCEYDILICHDVDRSAGIPQDLKVRILDIIGTNLYVLFRVPNNNLMDFVVEILDNDGDLDWVASGPYLHDFVLSCLRWFFNLKVNLFELLTGISQLNVVDLILGPKVNVLIIQTEIELLKILVKNDRRLLLLVFRFNL